MNEALNIYMVRLSAIGSDKDHMDKDYHDADMRLANKMGIHSNLY
ncbi:hypothetical protein B4140_3541 [Bacillus amyloliquefaciens]|nr:hypothetical protein B4140_3541 [Bacillus amyloliquefaciens]